MIWRAVGWKIYANEIELDGLSRRIYLQLSLGS